MTLKAENQNPIPIPNPVFSPKVKLLNALSTFLDLSSVRSNSFNQNGKQQEKFQGLRLFDLFNQGGSKMKLLSNWWKFHSAMLISLSLVLAGCGGAGGGGVDSGKGTSSSAGNGSSIPDNTSIPGSGSGSVADNSNTTPLPTGNNGNVEIFVDTNNAIDDLSLLNAGGVPTFGKKEKNKKSYKGLATNLTNLWAVQYTGKGVIEAVIPMVKSGAKYIMNADLSDTRDYKFVFFGYENGRWTDDPDETYIGPTAKTELIGLTGANNEFNGYAFLAASVPFLRTSTSASTKATITAVGFPLTGLTLTAKTGGIAGNSITVLSQETTRATYFVGVINAKPVVPVADNPFIRYRTKPGTIANVAIKFKYHPEYTPALSQVSTVSHALGLADAINEDFLMYENSTFDVSTNTITIHYGPATTLNTVACLLQGRNPSIIDLTDVVNTASLALDSQIANATILNPSESIMNSTNGNLNVSGCIDGVATNFNYIPGTSVVEVNWLANFNTTTNLNFYIAKGTSTTAARPTVALQGMGTGTHPSGIAANNTTLASLMKAYQDAAPAVRQIIDVTLVGALTDIATGTHSIVAIPNPANRRLSGGIDASGDSAVEAFDKSTNPNFTWANALALFNEDSLFPTLVASYTLGLRTGLDIEPQTMVGFDNLYKNFTYFGILHLKKGEFSTKKEKTIVEAKIVSAQSYRAEANIGPAIYQIDNDTFTLDSGTGEIILYIRNYYQSDTSLDDLRITVGIKDRQLDSDSGRVSTQLPIPALPAVAALLNGGFTIPVAANATVVDDNNILLNHPVSAPNTRIQFTNVIGGSVETDVFPISSSSDATSLFPHGDIALQDFTLTKKSRTSVVRNFIWDTTTTSVAGVSVTVLSQASDTDTLVFDQDEDMNTSAPGRDVRSSFISRSRPVAVATNQGTYEPNTGGEFIDIQYHLFYRPRSAVGTDTIIVFLEDGKVDPVNSIIIPTNGNANNESTNLVGPRDPWVLSATTAARIQESRSPAVGINGRIIPFEATALVAADIIYNTLTLEIPVDTVGIEAGSNLEEPDADVAFSIKYDAVAESGSTVGQTENDPSTMTVSATLTNEQAGETYTYRWNWSHFFELEGDNNFIGMPAGAALHGQGKHVVTFSDAVGLHPEFANVKVTIRASAGKDPEGTLRPFDPTTFNPTVTLIENIDRDFVFYDNYDAGVNAVNMSLGAFRAAVKLDTETDPTVAHLIVTPKTNGNGEIVASGDEIAEAIKYYIANSPFILATVATNSSFKLFDVYARGATTDSDPYWISSDASEANGVVFGGARTADDNAGSSLDIKFKNAADYLNVRETGAPVLTVRILDTVPGHNGSVYIINLSNAYPPVLSASTGTINDITYSFVSFATDGVTASSKKAKENNEIFLSVLDDTDADGAVSFVARVKRDNAGTNDSNYMQEKTKKIDGVAIGAPSDRSNQFVAYWDVRRVSDPTNATLASNLLGPGNSSLNNWVMTNTVDFVGSGADGNTQSIHYTTMYRAIYASAITLLDTNQIAIDKATAGALAAISGATTVNFNLIIDGIGGVGGVSASASVVAARAAAIATDVARIQLANNLAVPANGYNGATLALTAAAITAETTTATFSTGCRAGVYNAVYTASDINDSPVLAHNLALAVSNAVDRGILDEVATADALAAYNAIYNAVYSASLVDGDTVVEATAIAAIAGRAAASGASDANIVLIVAGQIALTGSTGAGSTNLTASNAAMLTFTTNQNAKLVSAITAARTTSNPAAISLVGVCTAPVVAQMPLAGTNGCIGLRARIYNAVYGAIDAADPTTVSDRIARLGVAPFGIAAEDWNDAIPDLAQKFNSGSKGDAGQHDAILASDPSDPTNVDLQHMLFSCRLILPTAAAARDAWNVTFMFRPGVAASVGAPILISNNFIITVLE